MLILVGKAICQLRACQGRKPSWHGFRKGCHDLSVICFDLARECRDCTRHPRFGDERHQAKHRQAAIVDLNVEFVGFLLVRQFLGEAKWVKEVQRHWVWDFLESREIAWLATTHIMSGAILFEHIAALRPKLKETNDKQDLQTACLWDCVPNCRRGE